MDSWISQYRYMESTRVNCLNNTKYFRLKILQEALLLDFHYDNVRETRMLQQRVMLPSYVIVYPFGDDL